MQKYSWGWYAFWGLLAVLSLAAGVVDYFNVRAFLASAELDTGTITDYALHVRTDGLSEYCPRIEFTTQAGEPMAVRGSVCPNEPDESRIGERVQVYFDPADPEAYRVKDQFTGYDGLIFGLIGAVFFGLFVIGPLALKLLPGRRKAPATTLSPLMQADAARYQANQRAAERKRQEEERRQNK